MCKYLNITMKKIGLFFVCLWVFIGNDNAQNQCIKYQNWYNFIDTVKKYQSFDFSQRRIVVILPIADENVKYCIYNQEDVSSNTLKQVCVNVLFNKMQKQLLKQDYHLQKDENVDYRSDKDIVIRINKIVLIPSQKIQQTNKKEKTTSTSVTISGDVFDGETCVLSFEHNKVAFFKIKNSDTPLLKTITRISKDLSSMIFVLGYKKFE